jgi:hypothetical protein
MIFPRTNDFFVKLNEPKFTDFENFYSSEIAIFRQPVSTCHKKYGRNFQKNKIKIIIFLSGLWPNLAGCFSI